MGRLQDAAQLRDFLDSELAYAVETAVENAILSGAAGSLIVGFLATSGLLTQAYATDPLSTLLQAMSQITATGIPVTGIVMSPQAWTQLMLTKDGQGRFLVGSGAPLDQAAQRIWGTPVVLAPSMPAGQALVGDFSGSSALFTMDNGAVRIDWSEQAMDVFTKNETIFRCETRLNLGVLRPAGFCKATLTGT